MKKSFFYLLKNLSIVIVALLSAISIDYILNTHVTLGEDISKHLIMRIYLGISVVYALIYFLMMKLFEADQIGQRRMLDIMYGHFAASVCINVIFALICWFLGGYISADILLDIALLVFAQLLMALIEVLSVHRIYEKLHFTKAAVFVHQGSIDSYRNNNIKALIERYFRITQDIQCEDINAFSTEDINNKIVFISDVDYVIRNEIIKKCVSENIECYTFPAISDVYIQNARIMQLRDKLLLVFPSIGIYGIRGVIKRIADVIISLVILIIMSPIMLIIAIAIKLTDGGPVFYVQDRVTMNDQNFRMYKFRSMIVGAENGGATLAKKEDTRITKVGMIIRNIHFDELPQLINVLKGDMSIVGPRPERRVFVDDYSSEVPEFKERLKVRGGLTGYAQVYGKYNTEPEDKLKYDLYYIYNYSLLLDVKILILTIRILFQPENTEGIDEGNVNALKKKH